MRHSSWTLFLFPLTLLLVLLIPGAAKDEDTQDPLVGARYEEVLGEGALRLEASPAAPNTLEESLHQQSEGLFKN